MQLSFAVSGEPGRHDQKPRLLVALSMSGFPCDTYVQDTETDMPVACDSADDDDDEDDADAEESAPAPKKAKGTSQPGARRKAQGSTAVAPADDSAPAKKQGGKTAKGSLAAEDKAPGKGTQKGTGLFDSCCWYRPSIGNGVPPNSSS